MARSKYFSTHQPVASKQSGDLSSLIGGGGSTFGGGSPLSVLGAARKGDEVDSYTLYNYLAVTRISMAASQHFPMVGTVEPAGAAAQSIKATTNRVFLSMREKKWLQHAYGGRLIQSAPSQEIALLPESHPLCQLFQSVNDDDWWETFLFELVLFLELTGEAYVWMVPSNLRTENAPLGIPAQLIVIPTQWVDSKTDRDGKLRFYKVSFPGESKAKSIPVEEIIPIRFKNPRHKQRGYSPGTAGGPWIDANNAIEEARVRTFGNSITPSVWLKVQKESGISPTNHELLDRIKERWMQRASGLDRYREPQIIPPGIDVDASGNFTPKEMDFNNSAPEVRDNILALRGVNKFIAGYTEGMNRAQVEVAMVHFSLLVINPLLRLIAGAFQEKLAPLYDPRIRIWFADTAPENREQMLSEAKFLWSVGGLTPNEARMLFAEFGFEKFEDETYDSGYIPAGLIPLGENLQFDDDADQDQRFAAAMEIYQEYNDGKSFGDLQANSNGNGKVLTS